MPKILVVGGYVTDEPGADKVSEFGKSLGREVIRQGHTLINACLTKFDRDTAEGAAEELEAGKVNTRIRTWVADGTPRVHEIGQLLISDVPNWDPAEGIDIPEPIKEADVLIFVRGYDGVNRAVLWADTIQKPLLPVASFGGSSNKLYKRELRRLDQRYTGRITQDDFIILREVPQDLQDLAMRVVALAENILLPRAVSVAMSYTDEEPDATHLKNLYAIYEEVCERFSYQCVKVTELNTTKGIVWKIKEEIKKAGFAFIDLTKLSPNVLFEYGYVDGLGKDFLVTAREGTKLPFNVQDIGTIFWKPDDMADFKRRLIEKFELIASKHGYVG